MVIRDVYTLVYTSVPIKISYTTQILRIGKNDKTGSTNDNNFRSEEKSIRFRSLERDF